MKLTKTIDIRIMMDDARDLRLCEEIEIGITGEEAVCAIFGETEGTDASRENVARILNNLAGFMKHVPHSEIQKFSPEARLSIAQFFRLQAVRFESQ